LSELRHGPLSPHTIHLCVDMQKLFSSAGPWPTPWMERVLPTVTRIAQRYADRTVFTRFITPEKPEDMPGTWQAYYERWRNTTRAYLDPELLDLMPPLDRLVPPAIVLDKPVYSPFTGHKLLDLLRAQGTDTLVITGSETDMCVLSTALGAVDHGYRVVLISDALCSSSDEGHDSLLSLYSKRFSQQIETIDSERLFSEWKA
jgi:nicotinamidase-related amidase